MALCVQAVAGAADARQRHATALATAKNLRVQLADAQSSTTTQVGVWPPPPLLPPHRPRVRAAAQVAKTSNLVQHMHKLTESLAAVPGPQPAPTSAAPPTPAYDAPPAPAPAPDHQRRGSLSTPFDDDEIEGADPGVPFAPTVSTARPPSPAAGSKAAVPPPSPRVSEAPPPSAAPAPASAPAPSAADTAWEASFSPSFPTTAPAAAAPSQHGDEWADFGAPAW